MSTHAVYLRVSEAELQRFVAAPTELAALDLVAALGDGRAIDLGRGWDELGCLLEGGISTPKSGPTVGDHPIATGSAPGTNEESETWNFVSSERVKEIALELAAIAADEFLGMYQVGDGETADWALDERTGAWADRAQSLFEKLTRLRAHYEAASAEGEAMLVRIAKKRP